MNDVGFGWFDALAIKGGELVLDPSPVAVRGFKFGSARSATAQPVSEEFELKMQVAEFFEYVRSIDAGEIRRLEVRHGFRYGGRTSPEREKRPTCLKPLSSSHT